MIRRCIAVMLAAATVVVAARVADVALGGDRLYLATTTCLKVSLLK